MVKNNQIIDNNSLLQIVFDHINLKKASSFIRKGDGENIIIGYKSIDEIKFKDYKHMMRIMNIRLLDFNFQKFIRKSLIDSFNNCDVLGISKENQRYGHWAIEDKVLELLDFQANKYCDMNFHMDFIKNPNKIELDHSIAKKIISNKEIGVISCFNVSEFLSRHNSIIKKWIKIPIQKDKIWNKKLNLNFYNYIFEEINQIKVDFWIVAAGIHAKIFCNHIKLNGGIGIDIGSSIDTWKNIYTSRGHLKEIYKKFN